MSYNNKKLLKGVIAGIAISVLSSQAVLAGGDLIPVAPVVEKASSGWTGVYVGGGLGIGQLKADVKGDSRNKSSALDIHNCRENGNLLQYGAYDDKKPYINKDGNIQDKIDFAKRMLKCAETSPHTKVVDYNWKYAHYDSTLDYAFSDSYQGDWNIFGTVMAGYDHQISDKLVVGVFGNLDFGSVDLDFNHSYTGKPQGIYYLKGGDSAIAPDAETLTFSGDLKLDSSATIGARFGHLFNNDKTLGYLLAGYSYAKADGSVRFQIDGEQKPFASGHNDTAACRANKNDCKHSYRYVPTDVSKKFSEHLNGLTVGAGAEHKLNDKWSLRLEYRYTWFNTIKQKLEDFNFSNDSRLIMSGKGTWSRQTETDTDIEIDPSLHSVRAAISYKFN